MGWGEGDALPVMVDWFLLLLLSLPFSSFFGGVWGGGRGETLITVPPSPCLPGMPMPRHMDDADALFVW